MPIQIGVESKLDPVDQRYVELSKRIEPATNIGAATIAVLIVIASATSWQRFLIALGAQLLFVPANVVFSRFVVPRIGPRAEIARSIANGILTGVTCIVIDWPLPVWLWLPFVAITFDDLGGRSMFAMVVVLCAIQDGFALASGVAWIYPLVFTSFALVCRTIANMRTAMIRTMLVRADEQRAELERAHGALVQEVAMRQQVELDLRQAQKLEAVGRLAAGVAHEINTPMQYIQNNVQFVSEGVADLLAPGAEVPEEDLAYLRERVPVALNQTLAGCERVAAIVRSMKQFARAGASELASTDLNEAIETTLTVARHEYAMVADVETDFTPLPHITCNAGEVNQVLLNLIVNAAHAIEDVVGTSGKRGRIRITTTLEDAGVAIAISDDGCGIPETIRDRIFDPFFTTKAVGRGSGQGLAISRSVIERHGGRLTFETALGRGTTFRIHLPHEPVQLAA